MLCTAHYDSPLGDILLAADEIGLTGLWFAGQKYYPAQLTDSSEGSCPVLEQAIRWLDAYFAGDRPDFVPAVHLVGTQYQVAVWESLLTIPYGKTATYGAIGAMTAERLGKTRFSARAVGAAVGRNPISVIVPCHRVVGANGSLTGYAGGLNRKESLLTLEGARHPQTCSHEE